MGILLPNYKFGVFEGFLSSIISGQTSLYAFGSNPVTFSGNTPAINPSDYNNLFYNDWQLLFGKLITAENILPVVNNVVWTSNTVYEQYDNTSNTLSNSNFYVVTPPSVPDGTYNIFKCIFNNFGANSTQIPDQIQPNSFTKSDGYTWRYITTISQADYLQFASLNYIPIYANSSIQETANLNNGVEVVIITNSGNNYDSYASGNVVTVVSPTLLQIQSGSSPDNDFYTNNAIYLYNNSSSTSQLGIVSQYIANSLGCWIYLAAPANTSTIIPNSTQYSISPQVVFQTDAPAPPLAYTTINSTSNSINSVVIIETGYGLSWANVSFISNNAYGNGATAYAIVPPPGGHGWNPAGELYIQGVSLGFTFANTDNLPQGISYNKIGLLANPWTLNQNNTPNTTIYNSNTFNQLLQANVTPPTAFTVGDTVTGETSGAYGIVAFSNSSMIYISGDKSFANGELILANDNITTAAITINTLGSLYTKNLNPMYYQNISNVTRSNTQSESFILIIQI